MNKLAMFNEWEDKIIWTHISDYWNVWTNIFDAL